MLKVESLRNAGINIPRLNSKTDFRVQIKRLKSSNIFNISLVFNLIITSIGFKFGFFHSITREFLVDDIINKKKIYTTFVLFIKFLNKNAFLSTKI